MTFACKQIPQVSACHATKMDDGIRADIVHGISQVLTVKQIGNNASSVWEGILLRSISG